MARRSWRWVGLAVGVLLVILATTWSFLHYRMPGTAVVAPPTSSSTTAPKGTQIITVVAVDGTGKPANGYQELVSAPVNAADVFGCVASPAAVAADIYSCAPSAAAADVCWPSTPGTLLCVDDPWAKGLHRVTTAPLGRVQPPPTPSPFALLLDDGTQCRLRNGGAWGGRDDGLVGAYGCPNETPAVLVPVRPDGKASAIDRSKALWTVEVGSLGSGEPRLPPPETRSVVTAWFAGK
ncbi:hypothetical protein [Mycobacterium kubicae]|uniref:Serine/threonine protein kinase n=1 Tax=Mycobacterium kubicae TaxID=120959 RepID=A0AAX1JJ62_9MYCO|nr:hypothetical protein [Mycobacterium kubicae]MCV7096026.1 hypothetical protein [Mycobacterium kubicae]ORV99290.1 hypothetical protein AWC13_11105 [Mycobacterium kubicae]QNI12187.1 hypothetical protein GAN18_14080 [Mycobacterium kubicae]QPI40418.1 hypothetical protein I2456_13885 [Mycobacterium kubicae]